YRPFLDVLDEHPFLRISLHLSGCLIEWLENHHPDYLDRIGAYVEEKRLEILTAGFYEPILAVIPDRDKVAQILKMNTYIRDRFHATARGLWLTERVWEPHLPSFLKSAGIRYLAVDDYHFLAAGKKPDELTGYFLTDNQGDAVGVFPIRQQLRYSMPFQEPDVTLEILRKAADENGQTVLVMADDGEKFGVWPGTYDRCYGHERWLDRMFTALEENRDWITTTTFGDYFDAHRPEGRVYLPTVSYFEMSEWTLPGDQGRIFSDQVRKLKAAGIWDQMQPFFRGGTWRSFQSLYDESNWMAKRNIYLSNQLEKAVKSGRLAPEDQATIETHLWRSQCNCAYWHGIFGGLYLPHLRHAIFQSLIKADSLLADVVPNGNAIPEDWDQDGSVEFILGNRTLRLFAGEKGGVIRELDLVEPRFNLTNTLRRYAESYHRRLSEAAVSVAPEGSIHDQVAAKEAGLEKLLVVDSTPRAMFQDHFFTPGATAEILARTCPEQGNFIEIRYAGQQAGNRIEFSAEGQAFGQSAKIEKALSLFEDRIHFQVRITNRSAESMEGVYASEFNLGLLGGHSPDRYYEENGLRNGHLMDAIIDDLSLESLAVVNEWDGFRIRFQFPEPVACWRYPVFTINMSESGIEKVYQGSAILPNWPISLQPNESKTIAFDLQVETWKTTHPFE
ncbi:MAG: alpha-amylase/4-alpha-glucanotransferase domain-containing protein, partial [Fidelibacterota bacterium]